MKLKIIIFMLLMILNPYMVYSMEKALGEQTQELFDVLPDEVIVTILNKAILPTTNLEDLLNKLKFIFPLLKVNARLHGITKEFIYKVLKEHLKYEPDFLIQKIRALKKIKFDDKYTEDMALKDLGNVIGFITKIDRENLEKDQRLFSSEPCSEYDKIEWWMNKSYILKEGSPLLRVIKLSSSHNELSIQALKIFLGIKDTNLLKAMLLKTDNITGASPVYKAARSGNSNLVKQLLDTANCLGILVEVLGILDRAEENPLIGAIASGDLKTITLLLEEGKKVNSNQLNQRRFYRSQNPKDFARWVIERAKIFKDLPERGKEPTRNFSPLGTNEGDEEKYQEIVSLLQKYQSV